MTQNSTDIPTPTPQADVRPQRPRAAPPRPALPELPNAWQKNPQGVAAIFLLFNLILFVYACMFFSRLTGGRFADLTLTGEVPRAWLGQIMRQPIDIYQVPLQGLVMALLLATFVTGPILIAQFYAPGWATLFLAPLLLIAHLPLLMAAMAGAVWLANTHRLGINNRFVRGIIALALPIVALWISTAIYENASKLPRERLYLHWPWTAAVLISAVMLLLFWLLARLLNYRAGLAMAALGLLLAAAEVAFAYGVGMDELEFRLLDGKFGLSSTVFQTSPLTEAVDGLVADWLKRDKIDHPTAEDRAGYRSQARTWLTMRTSAALRESQEIVGRWCTDFLTSFPGSRYAPYVRFLLARCQDMRVDAQAISRDERIAYYEDMVSDAGRGSWESLLIRCTDHPVTVADHPLAILARARLGQWNVARGHVEDGYQLLRDSLKETKQEPAGARKKKTGFFGQQPREPAVRPIIEERTGQTPYWLWLIERNRGDDGSGDEALSKLFALDAHDADYLRKLEKLRIEYKDTRLADNLDLLILLQRDDGEKRIQSLWAFIKSKADAGSDARYEAMARLANLLIKQKDPTSQDEARRLWKELFHSDEKLFADEARRGLVGISDPEIALPATRPH